MEAQSCHATIKILNPKYGFPARWLEDIKAVHGNTLKFSEAKSVCTLCGGKVYDKLFTWRLRIFALKHSGTDWGFLLLQVAKCYVKR